MFKTIASKGLQLAIAMAVALPVTLAAPAVATAGEGGGGEGGLRKESSSKKGPRRLKTRPRKQPPAVVVRKKSSSFTGRIKTRDGRRTWYKLRYRKGEKTATLIQYARMRRNGKWGQYRVIKIKIGDIEKNSRYNAKSKTTTIKVKDFGGKTRTFTVKGHPLR